MPVVITCPACQRKARIPNVARGKSVKCPSCGNTFTATGGDETSGRQQSDLDETAEPASPLDDARRVERIGVGLMTLSEALFAASLVLSLVISLLAMVPADAGPKNPIPGSFSQVLMLIVVLTGLFATVTALVGSVFCVVPPAAIPARAAAAAVLILTVLIVARAPGGSNHDLLLKLGPPMYQSARQAMLAFYVRVQALRLGEPATATMATILAVTYPVVVIGLATLTVLVSMYSGKPHRTFDQAVKTIDQLTQTALVAWSAFVLWRVWARLRPV
jgi:hypothetical protein